VQQLARHSDDSAFAERVDPRRGGSAVAGFQRQGGGFADFAGGSGGCVDAEYFVDEGAEVSQFGAWREVRMVERRDGERGEGVRRWRRVR